MKDPRIALQASNDQAPSEALRLRVRARVEKESASSTRMAVRIIVALVVAVCLTAAVVLTMSELVYQRLGVGLYLSTESKPHLLLVFCWLTGLALAATLVALSRGPRGFGFGFVSLAAVAALVAPVYAAVVLVSPVHTDGGVTTVFISPWGGRCLAIAMTVGVLVLACFAVALRRSAPVISWLRGGTLGAAAGAWAGLGIFIFCPSGDPQHLLLGHVLPVAALTLLGFIVVPRVIHL